MNVHIRTIDHNDQKYDTCGDYFEGGEAYSKHDLGKETVTITVSKLDDWRLEMLIAIHELVEIVLMKNDGVPLQASTDFDVLFEEARKHPVSSTEGYGFWFRGEFHPKDYEPGDSPLSPYQRQHNYATAVERMVCAAMGVKWSDYEDACNALGYNPK